VADDQRPPALRASDADREAVVGVLSEACGEGRLDADELDERVDAAYAARTLAELEPLTADLPGATVGRFPAPRPRPPAGELAPLDRWVVAIMGGADRKGRWRMSPRPPPWRSWADASSTCARPRRRGPRWSSTRSRS